MTFFTHPLVGRLVKNSTEDMHYPIAAWTFVVAAEFFCRSDTGFAHATLPTLAIIPISRRNIVAKIRIVF